MDVNRLMSVQSMMKMGIDFCPNFVQPFLENIDRRCCYDGSREPKIPILSSNLGLPCRGALLGRVEQEGGKISLDDKENGVDFYNSVFPGGSNDINQGI